MGCASSARGARRSARAAAATASTTREGTHARQTVCRGPGHGRSSAQRLAGKHALRSSAIDRDRAQRARDCEFARAFDAALALWRTVSVAVCILWQRQSRLQPRKPPGGARIDAHPYACACAHMCSAVVHVQQRTRALRAPPLSHTHLLHRSRTPRAPAVATAPNGSACAPVLTAPALRVRAEPNNIRGPLL